MLHPRNAKGVGGGGGGGGLGSGRKVTNSDCHSAHSSGGRRSGITGSELINQHTS